MVGADVMILLFGLGALALAWPVARTALASARATRRTPTILFGVGTVILVLAGLYSVAEGVLRLTAS